MAPDEATFFRKLADNSPLFIGMCDMQLVPFYLNDAGRRWVGLDDLQHFVDTPVREFFFPEDQDFIVDEFFPRVLREGRAETEIRFRHFKTGAAIWMTYDVFLLEGDDGAPVGLATVSREITETKRVEEALRESEERFSAIVNSAMDAIIALDESHNIVLFNPAAEKVFKCRADEALGKKIDLFIPQRFRETHDRRIDRFGEGDAAVRSIHPGAAIGLRADGSEFPIEASISRVVLKGRRVFSVILRDITDRRRAEAALRDSEERFSSFMRHLPGLAWIKRTDGRYTFVNEAAEKAFQLPATSSAAGPTGISFPLRPSRSFAPMTPRLWRAAAGSSRSRRFDTTTASCGIRSSASFRSRISTAS
jgi:PAS domain S-box-containing protein